MKKSQAVLSGALDTAHAVVEVASDKLASDIVLLDTCGLCSYADYLVLVNGESNRHLDAIADEIVHVLKQKGMSPMRREGTAASGWLLLDFSDVVVHIFAPNERGYYKLDDMWSTARPIVRLA
ncbi:MAG: ribosome silencing factor [Dehalococcoidia bacterium]|nr:ribosome silencing factor [Dehalococcoidia bacterium]